VETICYENPICSRLLLVHAHSAVTCALKRSNFGKPYPQAFEQLVAVVRGRVRYPEDFDTWHRDDQDEFKRSRYAIGDTLLDAAGA